MVPFVAKCEAETAPKTRNFDHVILPPGYDSSRHIEARGPGGQITGVYRSFSAGNRRFQRMIRTDSTVPGPSARQHRSINNEDIHVSSVAHC